MAQWLVIGISGVTCGGKTTMARTLRDYFQGQRNIQFWNTPYLINDVQLISQDDYFLPVDDLRHKWSDRLNVINFELLTSLDMKQMLSDITWTMNGRHLTDDLLDNIDFINEMAMSTNFEHYAPQTHYLSHYNQVQQQLNNPRLATSQIMRFCSTQIPGQVLDNKLNILIIEGFMIFNQPELLVLCNIKFHFHLPYEKCYERRRKRTYDPPDVTGYFEICVWPHYERNILDLRDRKDITLLNGEFSKEKIFKFVLQRIVNYFEERNEMTTCIAPHKKISMPYCSNTHHGTNRHISNICPMEQQ